MSASNQSESPLKSINPQTEPLKNQVKTQLGKKMHRALSKGQRVAIILAVLLLLSAGGIAWYRSAANRQGEGYLTKNVTRGNVTDSIEATGTLEPVKESEMGFKNDGTITVLNVQPGDTVTEGQILAQQDSTTLETAVQQAESSLTQAQFSLQSAVLTHEDNRKTLEQQQALFEGEFVSQSDLDTAKKNYQKSELDVASARAKLSTSQVQVAQAQADLGEATLTAPFAGIIGAVNGQVGQINGINSSTSTLLTVMSDDLQLSALINEADIGRIKIGQDVAFTSSAFTDKTFTGKVIKITPQAESVSNVQYYPVLISCNDPENILLSGMSVSANIIIASQTNVLTVPMMAVSYGETYMKEHPGAGGGGAAAANTAGTGTAGYVVVLENNQPVLKSVVLGVSDGSNYAVISGLNEGEQVIVGSQSAASSSSSSSNNSSNANKGGGMGMGGPPPGF